MNVLRSFPQEWTQLTFYIQGHIFRNCKISLGNFEVDSDNLKTTWDKTHWFCQSERQLTAPLLCRANIHGLVKNNKLVQLSQKMYSTSACTVQCYTIYVAVAYRLVSWHLVIVTGKNTSFVSECPECNEGKDTTTGNGKGFNQLVSARLVYLTLKQKGNKKNYLNCALYLSYSMLSALYSYEITAKGTRNTPVTEVKAPPMHHCMFVSRTGLCSMSLLIYLFGIFLLKSTRWEFTAPHSTLCGTQYFLHRVTFPVYDTV